MGQRGETEACFYLKRVGYRIVTTNFRAPHDRGEIDLIGWDGGTLCFIEVKTRTDDSFAPPSTAVTRSKQRHILSVAKRYLRHLSGKPACRFDILSVVPSPTGRQLQFSLLKGAFTWHTDKARRQPFRDFRDRTSEDYASRVVSPSRPATFATGPKSLQLERFARSVVTSPPTSWQEKVIQLTERLAVSLTPMYNALVARQMQFCNGSGSDRCHRLEHGIMVRMKQFLAIILAWAFVLATSPAYAQEAPPANLTATQIDALVAPIALYPDALVAQVLAASTYPNEVTDAEQWLKANSNLQGQALVDAVNQQQWDPSVQALTQFPSVLDNMANNLSWTSALGSAFYNQQADVMASVQRLRAQAKAAGNLKSSQQITVVQQDPQTIVIQPANPQVVYVPAYNPTVVYGTPYYPPGYSTGRAGNDRDHLVSVWALPWEQP